LLSISIFYVLFGHKARDIEICIIIRSKLHFKFHINT